MAVWVLFLAVVAYTGGVGTGWPLLQHVAYALAGVEVVALAAALLGRRAVLATSSFDPVRLTAGEESVETITIHKAQWLPSFCLELAGPEAGRREALNSTGDEGSWCRSRIFLNRGRYQVGGESVSVSDPFGLFSLSGCRLEPVTVTVYPQPIEVPDIGPLLQRLRAPTRRRQAGLSDGSLGDLRPYAPGDPPSRIHWRSTARTGSLVVRDPEYRKHRTLWILVDLGYGADAADRTAGQAAFLVDHLTETGIEIGALVAGARMIAVPPRAGSGQRPRILEALAEVEEDEESQLDLLARTAARYEHRDEIVVVSPASEAGPHVRRLKRLAPSVAFIYSRASS